jgi:hypothetical protein
MLSTACISAGSHWFVLCSSVLQVFLFYSISRLEQEKLSSFKLQLKKLLCLALGHVVWGHSTSELISARQERYFYPEISGWQAAIPSSH